MFGLKAQFCWYTELLFCGDCIGSNMRPLPWRVLYFLDDKPYRVSTEAADFIDSLWTVPVLDIQALDDQLYSRFPELGRTQSLREELVRLAVRVQRVKLCLPN